MKSQYRSNKSVAKNPTVPISADDPRVAWNKIANTKSRIGAEVDIVGFDGKSLSAGGTSTSNPSGATGTSGATNPVGTKSKTYVPPSNNKPGFSITDSFIDPTAVTNVSVSWSGDDLVITFDWDYENEKNQSASEFIVQLTGEGVTNKTPLGTFPITLSQTSQTVTVTKKINELTFGNFTVNLSAVCIIVSDAFFNASPPSCAQTVPPYVLDLPIPVITVTPITSGYSVAYTTPTQSIYDAIEISEYESNATTEPTGVTYTVTHWDTINPANVIVPNINPRWVKARFSSGARVFTAYCAAQKVTPTSPVSVDNTPPNEVNQIQASWVGDNISLTYKLPSQEAGVRIQIQLTAPNGLVGYFYRFPDGTGLNQSAGITKRDLFEQFGEHYNSFTGVLRSIDAADNKSAGVSFNVPLRANPLLGITPTFTAIGLSNAYSVSFALPTGAAFAEVYAKHTPWSGNPTDDTYVVYSGPPPAVIIDTDYTTVYIIIRYYDDFGNTSNYSAQGTVIPLNPGEITSFENPISFGENAVIFAGSSPTTGTRTLFKTGGIFAYDATNTSPSTQIVSNASAGTPTFITTQAQIADWNITETKIENTLAGAPTKYTGLSATGTYSFWAGSDVSGGNSSADFTVTPTGVVTARNITIIGNGNPSSNLISAGGLFTVKNDGTVTATGADIQGKITADSGEFTGNLSIGVSGSIYSGTLSGDNLSGAGFILDRDGLLFSSSSVPAITTINGQTGRLITKSAEIGDWTVDENSISKTFSGNGKIKLDSQNGYISVSNTNELNKLAGINAATTATDSVFWSGGTNPNATSNPFRVTFEGKLFTRSGQIGGTTNYWNITENGIEASGLARIKVGNYEIRTDSQSRFAIINVEDPNNESSIFYTDTVAGYNRIYLGQPGRQVEVAKNAEVSGGYGTPPGIGTDMSDQDERSGGLRNMYTITQSELQRVPNAFPDVESGSVLLVYDPTS